MQITMQTPARWLPPFNRSFGNPVIDRIFRIQAGKGIGISPVECINKRHRLPYVALQVNHPGKYFKVIHHLVPPVSDIRQLDSIVSR
jgi:hypothetical protein